MGAPNIPINVNMLMVKELNYKGSFRYGVGIVTITECIDLSYDSLEITHLPFLW